MVTAMHVLQHHRHHRHHPPCTPRHCCGRRRVAAAAAWADRVVSRHARQQTAPAPAGRDGARTTGWWRGPRHGRVSRA